MARRSTPRKMLNHIEPQWGKGLNTLNVDSSSNIGIIQANHHKAFDSGAFMFIPTAEVIESIMAYVEVPGIKEPFDKVLLCPSMAYLELTGDHSQKLSEDFWTYSFVPLSFNPDRSIFIKHIDENTPSDKKDKFVNAPGYTVCSHPYEHPMLQAVESHIHPFFVVFNAGEKIAALEKAERMELFAREPKAMRIEEIYGEWMDGYTSEVAPRRIHDDGVNEDCMSSLDEGDIPNSTDIHDDSNQIVASRDEDVYDSEDVDDILCTNSAERGSDDENAIFGVLPPSTVTDSTVTARRDDSASSSHDFGPGHHATSKSAVTAPAAFKLAGTQDVSTRVSNRFRGSQSTYESPLRSKSLPGQDHSLGDPRRSGHTKYDYDRKVSMRRGGSTQLASSKGSLMQNYSDADASPGRRLILEQKTDRIGYRSPKELESRLRAQNAHHSISEPTPRLDAEQNHSQSSSTPSSQMAHPVSIRPPNSLSYSSLPSVQRSEPRNPIPGSSTSGSGSALPQTPTNTRTTSQPSRERPTKRKRCRFPSPK
ncbi:hypothetical protein Moror_11521 [Moniliophthora roreri MCA 2997]|uniref:Uncharacterized protein n=1 Tax=Moniliophthora roreri (strain MCA 2997) TaxID=1381753 RepID=V2WB33_MONRO|nr:hypothetical protein Moror_11521 [Moniliophthora roreri MCA 2997]